MFQRIPGRLRGAAKVLLEHCIGAPGHLKSVSGDPNGSMGLQGLNSSRGVLGDTGMPQSRSRGSQGVPRSLKQGLKGAPRVSGWCQGVSVDSKGLKASKEATRAFQEVPGGIRGLPGGLVGWQGR